MPYFIMFFSGNSVFLYINVEIWCIAFKCTQSFVPKLFTSSNNWISRFVIAKQLFTNSVVNDSNSCAHSFAFIEVILVFGWKCADMGGKFEKKYISVNVFLIFLLYFREFNPTETCYPTFFIKDKCRKHPQAVVKPNKMTHRCISWVQY
jgi:hypothetical protein